MGIESFRKDLQNGMSIEDGLKKHGLTLREVLRMPKRSFVKPSQKGSITKTRKSGHYHIQKQLNSKLLNGGSYATRHEAELVRDKLYEHNWDVDCLPAILEELGIKRILQTDRKIGENTYIYNSTRGKTFYVAKSGTKFGTYSSIKDARTIRDELIACDWDKRQLETIKKKHNILNSQGK